MSLTLEQLNTASEDGLVALLDGVYEHSPWVAQEAAVRRPFTTLASLKHALADTVNRATQAMQLALIRAHPELAGKAMVKEPLV